MAIYISPRDQMCHVTQCSRKRNQQNFLFWKPQAREKAFPHRNSRSPCAECPPRTTASCGSFCAAPSRELLFRFSRSFLFASVTLCKKLPGPSFLRPLLRRAGKSVSPDVYCPHGYLRCIISHAGPSCSEHAQPARPSSPLVFVIV